MNTYYDKFMEINGADELKELVKRWEILSCNLSKRTFDVPVFLPDLFMYTRPGYGNTKLISLIAEYLDSKQNLMSFYGDVKFFEFKLEYCSPGSNFSELYRLMESIQTAAGFRNEYKGVIRINVDDWVGHHKEKHFLDFLQFLQINTSHWFVILTISNKSENDDTRDMEAVVSMYLRITTITLHMPSDSELVDYAAKHLIKYGLELDEGAKKVLLESIAVLRNNKYFYGLHTITDLCNDIVCSLFSKSTDVEPVIKAEMLNDFSADSEYIKRTVLKIKKTVTLGFNG